MVLDNTLNNLRERPKNERTAIAAWIAIVVVAILFICWLVYFFHSLATTPAPNLQNAANSSGLSQAAEQMQQAYGSSTQFIEAQGNIELQQIGTTTYSQQ